MSEIKRLWVVLRQPGEGGYVYGDTTVRGSCYFLGGLNGENIIKMFTERAEAETLTRVMNKGLAGPGELKTAIEKWRRP